MYNVRINLEYCKGCGLCVGVCAKHGLYISDKLSPLGIRPAAVRPEVQCTQCRNCCTICPDAAIEIVVKPPVHGETSLAMLSEREKP